MKTNNFLKCVILTLCFLTAQAQSSPPARFYYLGKIGTYPAQLELSFDGENLKGHYFYESVGLPIKLTQTKKGASYYDFVLEERPDETTVTGTWQGKLSSTLEEFGKTFSGTWTSPDGKILEFSFERVADFTEVSFHKNRLDISSSFPIFEGVLESFDVTINPSESLQNDLDSFTEGLKKEREGLLGNGWSEDQRYEIIYGSEQLLSLSSRSYLYMGGAHGLSGLSASSYLNTGVNVEELELTDLFEGTAPSAKLLDYITQDLKRQNASFILDGSTILDAENLQNFLLSPRGISFYYNPYEVGSYAEGIFEVVVPFDLVKDELRSVILSEFSR
jgi:hypothetical protein